jgi:hypothetical protein
MEIERGVTRLFCARTLRGSQATNQNARAPLEIGRSSSFS